MKLPIIPVCITAAEAIALIPNEATIAFAGFGATGVAQTLCKALATRYAREGTPSNLTAIHAAGHLHNIGIDLVASSGAIGRIIGGHWGNLPNVRRLAAEEKFEMHNWPQGVLIGSYRAAAAGIDGLRTPIGLDTFIDPRQNGGCVNESARKAGSLIEYKRDNVGEHLHYRKLKPDFAFIRGWKADRLGNISISCEPLQLAIDHIALATRNNGGKVFCQVCEVEDRIFSPNEALLPGFLIDGIIVAEDRETEHRHSATFAFEPSLLSTFEESFSERAHFLDPLRKWIGRRAAMEVMEGDLLNLGIGIPGDAVPPALKAFNKADKITSTLESGIVGGVSVGAHDFGVAFSPSGRLSEATMFDMYYGGNLDIAIMGMAETDAEGNINVSQFAGRNVGCGGFIDITQSAKRLVFCSGFNGKGFDGSFHDGKLCIHSEGVQKKFVRKVQQITFSAKRSRALKQKVILVTERCVFELHDNGWRLIEIAPGIDLKSQILSHLDFTPDIASDLRLMPSDCFAAT